MAHDIMQMPILPAYLRKWPSVMKSSSTERPFFRTSGEARKAYVNQRVCETEQGNVRRPFKQPRLISQSPPLQHPGEESSELFPPTHIRHLRPTTTQRVYGRCSRRSPLPVPPIDRHRRTPRLHTRREGPAVEGEQ